MMYTKTVPSHIPGLFVCLVKSTHAGMNALFELHVGDNGMKLSWREVHMETSIRGSMFSITGHHTRLW